MASGDRINLLGNPIKSVQRGEIVAERQSSDNNYKHIKEVTISKVDPSKTFVNVQPFIYNNTGSSPKVVPHGAIGKINSTGTQLLIYFGDSDSNHLVFWEVIEFN